MADSNRELADFLRKARSARDPLETMLPADGRVRRVPGLRREEVAMLAGLSTDYYTRLEQGRRIVPSAQVLDAVAQALGLDDIGRTHLHDLAGVAASTRTRARATVQRVRSGLYQLLDALDTQPALILGRRTDVLAGNLMAKALFTDFERLPARERNYVRWILLSDEARNLFIDWEIQARDAVDSLRFDAGKDSNDAETQKLVGELSLASAEFRRWWSEHRVHQRTFGAKRLHHPVVGELTVDYETFSLPGDGEQTLYIYTAAANSASQDALNLLAGWAHSQPIPPSCETSMTGPARAAVACGPDRDVRALR